MNKKTWSVLVVDDCQMTRHYLKKMLEQNGYQVHLSCDASEACWKIASCPPDFIVSDWQMPSMDGAALCQWVRSQQQKYVYFILMTAHERFFDVVDGLDSGADDYVQKPVKIAELLARLRCGQRILRLERSLRDSERVVTADTTQDMAPHGGT